MSSVTCNLIHLSHASAVARDNILRGHFSFLWENPINSSFAEIKPPSQTTAKISMIDNVGNLNKCANFRHNRMNMGAPCIREIVSNDYVTSLLIKFNFSRNQVSHKQARRLERRDLTQGLTLSGSRRLPMQNSRKISA
jgi:hypothetical protein